MKINKWGIRISLYISFLALLGAIHFKYWWYDLSFAIFGGSVFSLIICIVNYLILMKENAEIMVFEVQKMNNKAYSMIYSKNYNISMKNAMETLEFLNEMYYIIYSKSHEMLKSLFWFSLIKKQIQEIKSLAEKGLCFIYDAESYIEIYKTDAIKNSKKIYKELDKFIDDNTIYLKTLKLARRFGSSIHSLEESVLKQYIKRDSAYQFSKRIK